MTRSTHKKIHSMMTRVGVNTGTWGVSRKRRLVEYRIPTHCTISCSFKHFKMKKDAVDDIENEKCGRKRYTHGRLSTLYELWSDLYLPRSHEVSDLRGRKYIPQTHTHTHSEQYTVSGFVTFMMRAAKECSAVFCARVGVCSVTCHGGGPLMNSTSGAMPRKSATPYGPALHAARHWCGLKSVSSLLLHCIVPLSRIVRHRAPPCHSLSLNGSEDLLIDFFFLFMGRVLWEFAAVIAITVHVLLHKCAMFTSRKSSADSLHLTSRASSILGRPGLVHLH